MQALGKGGQPGIVYRRQGQRKHARQRLCAAGGQIAQVYGQRLVAQSGGVYVVKKMAACHQRIGRDGQHFACGQRQQGAVVPHAQRSTAQGRGAPKVTVDEGKFAQRRVGHVGRMGWHAQATNKNG